MLSVFPHIIMLISSTTSIVTVSVEPRDGLRCPYVQSFAQGNRCFYCSESFTPTSNAFFSCARFQHMNYLGFRLLFFAFSSL